MPRLRAGTGRVHGYHERTAADVPVDGRRVVVTARLRRLRCPVLGCRVQTFREQVPGTLERYQRRTARMAGQLAVAARELASRASARLLPALGGLGEAVRKEVAAHSACWAKGTPLQEGNRAETTLERRQQVHDLRSRGAGLLECARRLGLSLNTIKRYDRTSEPGRLRRVPKYRPTLVDPYRDYLRKRRAEEPGVPLQQLLREIRERGYQGSSNLLVRYINQGRLDGSRPHLSPRQATVWRAVWPMLQFNPVLAAKYQAMTQAADAAEQADGTRNASAAAAARARRAKARVACAASLLRWVYSMVVHDTSWAAAVAALEAAAGTPPAARRRLPDHLLLPVPQHQRPHLPP